MSIVTKAIGLAKKLKHRFAEELRARQVVYLSPVRRIERVALSERVCGMTFDDGPCRLPANPSKDGKPLTLHLAETLERFGAKGTFDIVGDTSKNYPDRAGKEGSASWGGVAYDHYPDFGKDADGGAAACGELVSRLLAGGHEITSHTWAHVLFGPKPLVYGGRKPLSGLDAVVEDLEQLDTHMREHYNYNIRLSRPPHYVDKTKDGFSSYDAYALMGYQYMAASYDGAGWLPLADYEAEVAATWRPIERDLSQDPDYFCGQIIFQKDGYNMARRSPVADGLEKQLELLSAHGYRVVTVSELLELCPFLDLAPTDPLFPAAKKLLSSNYCIAFRDNTVRAGTPLTRGALAMMVYGSQTARERVELVRAKKKPARDVSFRHPYAAAIAAAMQAGTMEAKHGQFFPDAPATAQDLARFGAVCEEKANITHADALEALAKTV